MQALRQIKAESSKKEMFVILLLYKKKKIYMYTTIRNEKKIVEKQWEPGPRE